LNPVKPRIRIKYCGGCNPGYDRSFLVERIKTRMGDAVKWVSSEPYDLVIAVQGCETACADLAEFEGNDVLPVNSFDDAEAFPDRIEHSIRGLNLKS
jgi:4-hydroxybutyrate CoA-transferase